MKYEENKNNGFTLVELIVVIAIMATIMGVLAPAYLKYVEKSRIAADKAAIKEIQECLMLELANHSLEDICLCCPKGNSFNWDRPLYNGITIFTMNNGGKIARGDLYTYEYSEGGFLYDAFDVAGLNEELNGYFSNNKVKFWKSKKLANVDSNGHTHLKMVVNPDATSVTVFIGSAADIRTGNSAYVTVDGKRVDYRLVNSSGTESYEEFLVGPALPTERPLQKYIDLANDYLHNGVR